MNTLLFIGIPCMDTIKTETVASLFGASPLIDCPAKLHIQKGCYVHDARNKIVKAALENGATHVLFIDSDIMFRGDAINKLLEQDKDIIGGLYYRRQEPHYPTFNMREGDKLVIPDKFPRDKSFEVYAIATGFMLVKTSVFKKITPPYFYFGSIKGKQIGEDVYFCWKAQERGFKVWCDPTVQIGHIGEYVFDVKDYDAYQEVRPKGNTEAGFDGEIN